MLPDSKKMPGTFKMPGLCGYFYPIVVEIFFGLASSDFGKVISKKKRFTSCHISSSHSDRSNLLSDKHRIRNSKTDDRNRDQHDDIRQHHQHALA